MFLARWRRRREIRQWERERLLFRYWDGEKIRSIDPFRVYRELKSDSTIDLETVGPLAERWEEPATTQLIDALCRAFGVNRYDDANKTGLTDAELLNLLGDLSDYLDYVKKKCNLGPTSQSATA